jgi:hypothetical protein
MARYPGLMRGPEPRPEPAWRAGPGSGTEDPIRYRVRMRNHHPGVPTVRRFTQVGGPEFLFKPDGFSGTGP